MEENNYRNLIRPDAGYARHAQFDDGAIDIQALIRRLAE